MPTRQTIGFLTSNIHTGASQTMWPGLLDAAENLEKMSRVGLMIGNVRGLSLDHVQINQQSGPAILLSDARQVRMEHCGTTTVSAA